VGVTNVKKLVEVAREGKRPIVLISTFDVFVDLPSNRKGANLSRNFEAIDEVLEEAISAPVYEIEELCSEVARRLLNRHEYASKAEVRMRSEYIIKHQTPKTKTKCQEVVNIFAGAVANRAEELQKLNVPEATVNAFLDKIPMATHNQRGRGSISIEVHDGDDVRMEKLIDIIKNSMSSQIYELLKRPDETFITETAHRNPRFAEDCVRLMAQMVVQEFPEISDDSIVTIKQVNEESIHQHDVFAERTATMGELRSEMSR